MHFYTPRVRTLWSGSDGWDFSGIFPALSVSLPESLFPNLLTLNWHHFDEGFSYIHLFLRPTLTTLYLLPNSNSASSLLSILPAKCPKLIDITISTRGHDDSEAISDFLRALKSAQKISIPSLNQAALEHISHLTTLKSLTLQTLPSTLTLSPVRETPTFPVLRRLLLIRPDLRPTTQFLGWCRGVPLHTLHISCEVGTADEMQGLLTAVSAGCLHPSLADLTIDSQFDESDVADPNFDLIPIHSLRRLFCFANFTTLSISSVVGFDLDNDAVSELARAWPQIVSLRLKVVFPIHTPRTTLACLHSFAQHCPRLKRLTIALDATSIPNPEADPRTRFVQYALETLGVEHSPMLRPLSVARFLSGVFPKLAEVDTHREHDDNDDEEELRDHGAAIRLHNRWKEVRDMLPELSAIREEGRMLGQASSGA